MKSHFIDRRLSKIPDFNRKWDLTSSNRNATLILLIFCTREGPQSATTVVVVDDDDDVGVVTVLEKCLRLC